MKRLILYSLIILATFAAACASIVKRDDGVIDAGVSVKGVLVYVETDADGKVLRISGKIPEGVCSQGWTARVVPDEAACWFAVEPVRVE